MYLLQFEIQQRKAGPERNSEKRKGKEGFGLEKIVFPEKKNAGLSCAKSQPCPNISRVLTRHPPKKNLRLVNKTASRLRPLRCF